jgi:hypothetical protein
MRRIEVQKVSTRARVLPERKHLEITFPRVGGYVFDVRQRIRLNLDEVPYLVIDPSQAPTEVTVKPAVGYRNGRPDRLERGPEGVHDRNPFHGKNRLEAAVYEIAVELTRRLKEKREEWSAGTWCPIGWSRSPRWSPTPATTAWTSPSPTSGRVRDTSTGRIMSYVIQWHCEDRQGVKIILEVKGFETQQDRHKKAATRRWVRAVNRHGEFTQ